MDTIENQSFYRSVIERILNDCIKESVIVKHSDIKQFIDIDDKPELNNQPVINFDPKRFDKYVEKIIFIITKEIMLARQSEIIRILESNVVKINQRNVLERRLGFIADRQIMLDRYYKDTI